MTRHHPSLRAHVVEGATDAPYLVVIAVRPSLRPRYSRLFPWRSVWSAAGLAEVSAVDTPCRPVECVKLAVMRPALAPP